MYNLFLDDYRIPRNCLGYVHRYGIRPDIYINREWIVVTNYIEFTEYISKNGLPNLISFDHDLADFHYQYAPEDYDLMGEEEMIKTFGSIDKTGYDCAKWLVEYCLDNNLDLPEFLVHSMNTVGKQNIENLLNNFKNKI